MIKLHRLFKYAAAATLLQAGTLAFAADSLDALLQEVSAGRSAESQAFEQRSAAYNAAAAADQQKMLAEAQARRDALDAKSEALSGQFSANELKINELDKQLQEKAVQPGPGRGVRSVAAGCRRQRDRPRAVAGLDPVPPGRR